MCTRTSRLSRVHDARAERTHLLTLLLEALLLLLAQDASLGHVVIVCRLSCRSSSGRLVVDLELANFVRDSIDILLVAAVDLGRSLLLLLLAAFLAALLVLLVVAKRLLCPVVRAHGDGRFALERCYVVLLLSSRWRLIVLIIVLRPLAALLALLLVLLCLLARGAESLVSPVVRADRLGCFALKRRVRIHLAGVGSVVILVKSSRTLVLLFVFLLAGRFAHRSHQRVAAVLIVIVLDRRWRRLAAAVVVRGGIAIVIAKIGEREAAC